MYRSSILQQQQQQKQQIISLNSSKLIHNNSSISLNKSSPTTSPSLLLSNSSPSSSSPCFEINIGKKQQFIFLCKLNDFNNNKKMLEININDSDKLLLIYKESFAGSEFFALQSICPNCKTPLINGVLCKSHIRCSIHGSAYNLRTGILEDSVGLNSIWTFKIHLIGTALFTELISLEKLKLLRTISNLTTINNKSLNNPIIIVGGGIAGITCIETLRHLKFSKPIVLISRENELPYDRKLISKKLFNNNNSSCFILRSREFLEKYLGVHLLLGHNVRSVRTEEKRILVEFKQKNGGGGEPTLVKALEYEELVLCLGATSKRLQGIEGSDYLEGIIHLRTLKDAQQLNNELKESPKNVAIIGSGFLGFEISSLIYPIAKSISIYGKASTPLTLLGSEVGNEIRKFIREQGVIIRQDSVLRSMGGFDRVQDLKFRDGLIAIADTVIVAIGIMPSTSILMGSGIRTNAEGYILVDEAMRTNIPNIYACGDCVNFPINGQIIQRRINLPHWQIAQYQGKIAAYSLMGISARPRLVPFLWIRLFDRHLTFSSLDPTIDVDERILRGSIAENNFVAYFLKSDKVVGVANCGPLNVAIQFMEIFKKDKIVTKAEDFKYLIKYYT
ncbi:Rieske domain-containing protein [Meloidogyne graminicola]|uniref:Rieske domain-containing protein n=1 Tax=Meloidogyne graminicola TaxID=189291 RepID=A0A8S9ZXB7_9BILA|nr:Rieske domain-containing protein [Meloidogyne graminicola]